MKQHNPAFMLIAALVATPPSVGLLVYFVRTGEPASSAGVPISAAVLAAALLVLLAEVLERLRDIFGMRETLKGASEFVGILKAKQVYRRRSHALADIQDALRQQAQRGSGRIIMCGVSLRHYFQAGYDPDFVSTFLSLLRKGEVDLCVAVLDPGCTEARRRDALEKSGRTRSDIRQTIEVLEAEARRPDMKGRVALALYHVRPFLFAILTEDEAFVQRYISAPPADRADLWEAGPGRCYGDYEPLIRYARESDQYAIVRSELLDMMASECGWAVGDRPVWRQPHTLPGTGGPDRKWGWLRLPLCPRR